MPSLPFNSNYQTDTAGCRAKNPAPVPEQSL